MFNVIKDFFGTSAGPWNKDNCMSEWIPLVVVEDNELIRTTTERKQKLCDFQVCSAENSPAGLQLAREKYAAGHTNLI
jgi:hypothetical protein